MEAYAFWGFFTVICLAGIISTRWQAYDKTKVIRSLIDSEAKLEAEQIDKIMEHIERANGKQRPLYQDLKLGAPISLFAGLGAIAFAFITKSFIGPAHIFVIAGGVFAMLNGLGLYLASIIMEKYETKA